MKKYYSLLFTSVGFLMAYICLFFIVSKIWYIHYSSFWFVSEGCFSLALLGLNFGFLGLIILTIEYILLPKNEGNIGMFFFGLCAFFTSLPIVFAGANLALFVVLPISFCYGLIVFYSDDRIAFFRVFLLQLRSLFIQIACMKP